MAKKRKKPTTTRGKIWYFIWYDNSIWSWLANIVLAFILIKFIIYPVLGALLGTGLPVVAVVSESMDHRYVKDDCRELYKLCSSITPVAGKSGDMDTYWNRCGNWYLERGINKEAFSDYPFKNGFSKGDIIILVGKEPENIDIGDVIVFQAGKSYPIIHRVVNITDTGYETKGDHNPAQIQDITLDERDVKRETVLGVAVGKIPYLGWVKIGLVELLNGRQC